MRRLATAATATITALALTFGTAACGHPCPDGQHKRTYIIGKMIIRKCVAD